MTIAPTLSSFEPLCAHPGDELAAAAKAAAGQTTSRPGAGTLIVVVHPEHDRHQVLAADGVGVLRAAVSVAVSAGHHRLWADAPSADTIEQPVRALPEVVRAAAEASRIVAVHTGTVRTDDRLECVAIWFEPESGVESIADRRHVLQLLAAAAERDAVGAREAHTAEQLSAATNGSTDSAESPSASQQRQFDPDDANLDPLTGLATRACFENALGQYESDHATLVVIDVDHFDTITEEFGMDAADRVLREVADRLVTGCRQSDLIARIDIDMFAILFDDVERSTALDISKRLLGRISEPLATDPGPATITATVALSHQFGLVDTDELMESATDALNSGKRSGRGRLFLGS